MEISKPLLLTAFLSLIHFFGYSQQHKINKDKVHLIELRYDTVLNELIALKKLNLKNNYKYKFKLTGLNTAYHSVDMNADYLKRVSNMPDILKNLVPVVGGQYMPVLSEQLFSDKLKTDKEKNKTESDFIEPIKQDYNFLIVLTNSTKYLVEILPDIWTNDTLCHAKADSIINILRKSFPTHFKDSSIIKNGLDLMPITEMAMNDFLTRMSIVKTDDFKKKISIEDLNKLMISEKYILENKDLILKAPDIIHKIQHCKTDFLSETYKAKGDYIRFSSVIFQNKFESKSDTLLVQKIDFYKVNYCKIDFSGGFFLNNLGAQSYHYTDTMGRVAREKNYKMDLSVGALVHAYWVCDKYVKLGACLGAGLSILDAKTKYFVGPSIVLGGKNEIAISGGLAAASLPHVSDVVNSNGFKVEDLAAAVPTYNKLTFGYFVGISYTFIKN